MQPLEEQHTDIILRLLSRIKSRKVLDISLSGHLPLRLQNWGPVSTREGLGIIFGIGLLIDENIEFYDTRMTFIVIDKRETSPQGTVRVFPMHYHDQFNQVLWIGVAILGRQVGKYNDPVQERLSMLAGNWLTGLARIGYV